MDLIQALVADEVDEKKKILELRGGEYLSCFPTAQVSTRPNLDLFTFSSGWQGHHEQALGLSLRVTAFV